MEYRAVAGEIHEDEFHDYINESVKKGTANPCCVCGKSVYLMERFTAEGKLYHRVCVKCSVCDVQLKTSTYEYDSKTEKFFCEKHFKNREELLKKRDEPEGQELSPSKTSLQNIPEDTPMEDDAGSSSGEDPLTPFRRNEPFVRKGIRPQSSPADMNWEKVNIIKSREENHPTPSKSKEGAKSFLSNVITKKTSKDNIVQQTDFSNPAYQQHLELSKFMNKINKDESWEDSDRVVIGSETKSENNNEIERVRTLSKVELPANTLSNQEIFAIAEKEGISHANNNEMKKKKLVLRKKKKKKDTEVDHNKEINVNSNLNIGSSSSIADTSENYENLDYASAYLSAANNENSKNDYENIDKLPTSEPSAFDDQPATTSRNNEMEVTPASKINEFKSATDSNVKLRNQQKGMSPRAESCIDLATPETKYLEIRSNLKKVKSHSNIAEETERENTLEEFHKMRSKLKKTNFPLDDSDNKIDKNLHVENKNDEETVSFESHLNKKINEPNEVNNKNKNIKSKHDYEKQLDSTPAVNNQITKIKVKKEDSNNPFLSSSDNSPEIVRKSNNSKLDNTNPFLTSTEDLLFDSEDDFDDSNPFAEDARIERRDTLQKGQAQAARNKLQQNFAPANPFLDSSSEDENVPLNADKAMEPLKNKPTPRPRSKKRDAPKRPDRPPQLTKNSPQVQSENQTPDLKRRNSGKKRKAPKPPQKTITENTSVNGDTDSNHVSGNNVVLLSKKNMPHDYCSIDSLARQTKANLDDTNDSDITQENSKPEKRQAPRRPVSAQLSYDEATILQSVALRDKQPKRDEIEQELKFLEVRQRELEMEGVVMEKKLRESMRGEPEEQYLVAWFELVNQKNQLLRRENELIYMCQEMDFLKAQRRAEFELRKLMSKPEKLRSPKDKQREEELLQQILEFVTKRSHIVDRMDEERLREYEEDQEIMFMMEHQGLRSPSIETSTPEKATENNEKKKKNKKEKKKKEKEKAAWKKKTL